MVILTFKILKGVSPVICPAFFTLIMVHFGTLSMRVPISGDVRCVNAKFKNISTAFTTIRVPLLSEAAMNPLTTPHYYDSNNGILIKNGRGNFAFRFCLRNAANSTGRYRNITVFVEKSYRYMSKNTNFKGEVKKPANAL